MSVSIFEEYQAHHPRLRHNICALTVEQRTRGEAQGHMCQGSGQHMSEKNGSYMLVSSMPRNGIRLNSNSLVFSSQLAGVLFMKERRRIFNNDNIYFYTREMKLDYYPFKLIFE